MGIGEAVSPLKKKILTQLDVSLGMRAAVEAYRCQGVDV
jgi:hypothetical protein